MDRVIDLFLEDPERGFHIREVAKLLHISPTTASKYLKRLEEAKVLSCKRERGHLIYKAHNESEIYKGIKVQKNIQRIKGSGVIGYLNDFFNHPVAIVLFGSFGKGENTPSSDIDIFILTPQKKEPSLSKFERKLKHKVQLFLYSKEDIERMKNKNKELLNNIINGIVLDGFLEVFV